MSKRSLRLAAVAGLALSIGAMAPAMAVRVGGVAGAEVDVDHEMAITDVLNIADSLPIDLPSLPSTHQVFGLTLLPNLLVGQTFHGLTGVVAAADLGDILPECGLVAVASCNGNNAGNIGVELPVDASELNVLGGGILSNNTGLALPGLPGVPGVRGLLTGIGGLLNVEAGGSLSLSAIAGMLGTL